MEDVGRVPTDLPAAPPLEPTTIPTLDGWIEALMNCKQLAESDVQRLCEKVRTPAPQGPCLGCVMAPRPCQIRTNARVLSVVGCQADFASSFQGA